VEAELGEVDSSASLRERLAQHRENPTCATCHDQMDPIGLGMEAFDGIGTSRDVDSSGELPGGRAFEGPAELSAILAADPRFTDCFTTKLMVYALGRGIKPSDVCAVAGIKDAFAAADHRMADLVAALATSPIFTHRRGEPEGDE